MLGPYILLLCLGQTLSGRQRRGRNPCAHREWRHLLRLDVELVAPLLVEVVAVDVDRERLASRNLDGMDVVRWYRERRRLAGGDEARGDLFEVGDPGRRRVVAAGEV